MTLVASALADASTTPMRCEPVGRRSRLLKAPSTLGLPRWGHVRNWTG